MISKFETLAFEKNGDIGILKINRPTKLNALNIQVLSDLKNALTELAKTELKGLIVTGEGEKAFIAGADIAEMKPMSKGEGKAFSELGHQVTILFESQPFPVVAAVNGFALGGGFEMALSCDFIFASKNAVFGMPETKLGLIPGFGGTQRLPKAVGERRAKELLFSGRNIPSEEAKNLGIVLELFETPTELMEGTLSWFKLTTANSLYAISRAKKCFGNGLEKEAQEFGDIFQTIDMIEGTSAFTEKRKATFKGKYL